MTPDPVPAAGAEPLDAAEPAEPPEPVTALPLQTGGEGLYDEPFKTYLPGFGKVTSKFSVVLQPAPSGPLTSAKLYTAMSGRELKVESEPEPPAIVMGAQFM